MTTISRKTFSALEPIWKRTILYHIGGAYYWKNELMLAGKFREVALVD